MVNRVLHDPVEQRFVGVATPRHLFRQIFDGKIPNFLFEQVATLVPAGDEFVPGNRRLGPLRFGSPERHRIAGGDFSSSFIPKEQMLKQRRNGMSSCSWWRRRK